MVMKNNKNGSYRPIQGNSNTTWLISQIKKTNDQYPLLTKEQEQEMIQKYRNNREELNRRLIMHNMKIVFNIAKRYAHMTDDFDSLVQDGMLGLAEAAQRFDIDAGIKFITYAHVWVKKYVLSSFYTKNIEVDKNSTSLNSVTFSQKDGDKTEFEDYVNSYVDPSVIAPIHNVVDEVSANEQQNLCNELLQHLQKDTSLSAMDKNVFIDIFYNRERPVDVADKYDLTRQDVTEIKHKVLDKFRNILASDYDITDYEQVC